MRYESAAFEASFGTAGQLPESTLPEVAFSGRSNVGKSSLLNKLLNRKSLARVSSVPGKTVTVNFFKLDSCRFVDLPGYGYARVNREEKLRWAELMEGYFSSGRNIRLVVQLVDMRHKPTDQDRQMIEFMIEKKIPFIIAMTKADKLNKAEFAFQKELIETEIGRFGSFELIPFSAVSGIGSEKLKLAIESAVEGLQEGRDGQQIL